MKDADQTLSLFFECLTVFLHKFLNSFLSTGSVNWNIEYKKCSQEFNKSNNLISFSLCQKMWFYTTDIGMI